MNLPARLHLPPSEIVQQRCNARETIIFKSRKHHMHSALVMKMDSSEDVVMEPCSTEYDDVAMTSCGDEAMPGLEPVSESEDSYGSSSSKFPYTRQNYPQKKKVSWDSIHTREFALVVGDHPLCQDGLPVSLDWQHADHAQPVRKIMSSDDAAVSVRKQSYVFPRRLSYEERRQRLCCVSGLTVDQVKNDEIDLVVRTLKESWDCVAVDTSSPPFDPTPLAEDDSNIMFIWEDVISQDFDIDLGDISDFEWTD